MNVHPSASAPALRQAALAAALCCALAPAALAQAAVRAAAPGAEAIAPGRVLVMPRAGLDDAAVEGLVKGAGGNRARRVGRSELRIVDLPPGLERQLVERLSRHPHVKFAEVDTLTRPDAASNDPYLGSQWHLGKIGALAAWDHSQGKAVTIAVLDTGVDATHPDLAPQMAPGWNFFNNSADTSDAYNHGTGVAGAAAAAANNALGVAGVAGHARIMPIRITDASGYASLSAMAQGLTHAADQGARVANISFSSAARSASVISAAQYMRSKGGLVFVSAGNTGTAATGSPTAALIVVSGTNPDDSRASWSTYGPVVSLAAPGSGIYTTGVGGSYVADNGTSFAAPVAAGVAALVMALKPALSAAQVESVLFATAVDLGASGRDDAYGHGRVDAERAVQAALATAAAPADLQPPAVQVTDIVAGTTVSGLVPVNVAASDNVGVARVELRVNGSVVATDTGAPFAFSWDSSRHGPGSVTLSATAVDAAGNTGTSQAVTISVAAAAAADTAPPAVRITNPSTASVPSGTVSIEVSATDDRPVSQLRQTLYIDGKVAATASGGALTFKWNTRKLAAGSHTLRAVALDAAGNQGEATLQVVR